MKQKNIFFIFFVLLVTLVALIILRDIGYRNFFLFITSLTLGSVFYLSFFGFTGGWKKFILTGETLGVRSQILLIILATLLTFPLINLPSPFFNFSHGGSYAPIGFSLIIGSFLFGAAMQIAGGCASGTLFSAGGGNTKMLLVLISFIIGSTIGTYYFDTWSNWPSLPIIKFDSNVYLIFVLILGIFVYKKLIKIDANRTPIFNFKNFKQSTKQHITPIWFAILSIAILYLLILILSGHPWSVTFGFSLWGSKFANIIGIDATNWSFWNSNSFTQKFIQESILQENTSLTNIGLMSGALLTSIYLGNFFHITKINSKEIFKIIVAGLVMGIGARLAFGCNIGAMLGGIVSGSLHGWVWLICAFAGSYCILKVRWHE